MPIAHADAKLLAALRRAKRLVLTTHAKPDADALGSLLALTAWLRAEGKEITGVLPTHAPEKYSFLDPEEVLQVVGRDIDPADIPPPDLVVVLDTGTWQQLDPVRPLIECGAEVAVIDHHRTQDPLSDLAWVEPEAPACATMVYDLLREAGADITPAMATALITGLAGDTDWFRLPSGGASAFRQAAELVDLGASYSEVYRELFQSFPLSRARLMALAIEEMRPAFDGRLMVMRVTQNMFRQAGAEAGDTEGLINEAMKIRGVDFAIMLTETDSPTVRVSLRCRVGNSILDVARQFGGGGHLRAAGMQIEGSLDKVEQRVLEAMKPAVE